MSSRTLNLPKRNVTAPVVAGGAARAVNIVVCNSSLDCPHQSAVEAASCSRCISKVEQMKEITLVEQQSSAEPRWDSAKEDRKDQRLRKSDPRSQRRKYLADKKKFATRGFRSRAKKGDSEKAELARARRLATGTEFPAVCKARNRMLDRICGVDSNVELLRAGVEPNPGPQQCKFANSEQPASALRIVKIKVKGGHHAGCQVFCPICGDMLRPARTRDKKPKPGWYFHPDSFVLENSLEAYAPSPEDNVEAASAAAASSSEPCTSEPTSDGAPAVKESIATDPDPLSPESSSQPPTTEQPPTPEPVPGISSHLPNLPPPPPPNAAPVQRAARPVLQPEVLRGDQLTSRLHATKFIKGVYGPSAVLLGARQDTVQYIQERRLASCRSVEEIKAPMEVRTFNVSTGRPWYVMVCIVLGCLLSLTAMTFCEFTIWKQAVTQILLSHDSSFHAVAVHFALKCAGLLLYQAVSLSFKLLFDIPSLEYSFYFSAWRLFLPPLPAIFLIVLNWQPVSWCQRFHNIQYIPHLVSCLVSEHLDGTNDVLLSSSLAQKTLRYACLPIPDSSGPYTATNLKRGSCAVAEWIIRGEGRALGFITSQEGCPQPGVALALT